MLRRCIELRLCVNSAKSLEGKIKIKDVFLL